MKSSLFLNSRYRRLAGNGAYAGLFLEGAVPPLAAFAFSLKNEPTILMALYGSVAAAFRLALALKILQEC